ncbi:MAG: hypothetical protein ACOCT9_00025 [archaeon]
MSWNELSDFWDGYNFKEIVEAIWNNYEELKKQQEEYIQQIDDSKSITTVPYKLKRRWKKIKWELENNDEETNLNLLTDFNNILVDIPSETEEGEPNIVDNDYEPINLSETENLELKISDLPFDEKAEKPYNPIKFFDKNEEIDYKKLEPILKNKKYHEPLKEVDTNFEGINLYPKTYKAHDSYSSDNLKNIVVDEEKLYTIINENDDIIVISFNKNEIESSNEEINLNQEVENFDLNDITDVYIDEEYIYLYHFENREAYILNKEDYQIVKKIEKETYTENNETVERWFVGLSITNDYIYELYQKIYTNEDEELYKIKYFIQKYDKKFVEKEKYEIKELTEENYSSDDFSEDLSTPLFLKFDVENEIIGIIPHHENNKDPNVFYIYDENDEELKKISPSEYDYPQSPLFSNIVLYDNNIYLASQQADTPEVYIHNVYDLEAFEYIEKTRSEVKKLKVDDDYIYIDDYTNVLIFDRNDLNHANTFFKEYFEEDKITDIDIDQKNIYVLGNGVYVYERPGSLEKEFVIKEEISFADPNSSPTPILSHIDDEYVYVTLITSTTLFIYNSDDLSLKEEEEFETDIMYINSTKDNLLVATEESIIILNKEDFSVQERQEVDFASLISFGELEFNFEETVEETENAIVNTMYITSDEDYIYSGMLEDGVYVYDIEDFSLVTILDEAQDVDEIRILKDDIYAFSSDDKTIYVYSKNTFGLEDTINSSNLNLDNDITNFILNDEYLFVYTVFSGDELKVFDLETLEHQETFSDATDGISFLEIDEDYIYCGSYDNNIYYYDLEDLSLVDTIEGDGEIYSIYSDGTHIYVEEGISSDRIVYKKSNLEKTTLSETGSFVLNHSDDFVYIGDVGEDGEINIYEKGSLELVETLDEPGGYIYDININSKIRAITDDGNMYVYTKNEGTDLSNLELFKPFELGVWDYLHLSSNQEEDFNQNEDKIYITNPSEGTISIYDKKDFEKINEIKIDLEDDQQFSAFNVSQKEMFITITSNENRSFRIVVYNDEGEKIDELLPPDAYCDSFVNFDYKGEDYIYILDKNNLYIFDKNYNFLYKSKVSYFHNPQPSPSSYSGTLNKIHETENFIFVSAEHLDQDQNDNEGHYKIMVYDKKTFDLISIITGIEQLPTGIKMIDETLYITTFNSVKVYDHPKEYYRNPTLNTEGFITDHLPGEEESFILVEKTFKFDEKLFFYGYECSFDFYGYGSFFCYDIENQKTTLIQECESSPSIDNYNVHVEEDNLYFTDEKHLYIFEYVSEDNEYISENEIESKNPILDFYIDEKYIYLAEENNLLEIFNKEYDKVDEINPSNDENNNILRVQSTQSKILISIANHGLQAIDKESLEKIETFYTDESESIKHIIIDNKYIYFGYKGDNLYVYDREELIQVHKFDLENDLEKINDIDIDDEYIYIVDKNKTLIFNRNNFEKKEIINSNEEIISFDQTEEKVYIATEKETIGIKKVYIYKKDGFELLTRYKKHSADEHIKQIKVVKDIIYLIINNMFIKLENPNEELINGILELWAKEYYIHNQMVLDLYGELVGLTKTIYDINFYSEMYFNMVKALWFILVNGPTIKNIKIGLYIFFNLPISLREKAEIEIWEKGHVKLSTGEEWEFNEDVPLIEGYHDDDDNWIEIEGEGDTVPRFTFLVDGPEMMDYLSHPEWWKEYDYFTSSIDIEKYCTTYIKVPGKSFDDKRRDLTVLGDFLVRAVPDFVKFALSLRTNLDDERYDDIDYGDLEDGALMKSINVPLIDQWAKFYENPFYGEKTRTYQYDGSIKFDNFGDVLKITIQDEDGEEVKNIRGR